jgi:hypothetical protein
MILGWFIVILMALLVVVAIVMSRPKAPPTNDADLQVPTAEDGREVMDIAGECWIDDPNIIWYGDLRTAPIHAKSGK